MDLEENPRDSGSFRVLPVSQTQVQVYRGSGQRQSLLYCGGGSVRSS